MRSGRWWPREEETFIALREDGVPFEDIAIKLRRTIEDLMVKAAALGLLRVSYTKIERQTVIDMLAEGFSNEEIGQRICRPTLSVAGFVSNLKRTIGECLTNPRSSATSAAPPGNAAHPEPNRKRGSKATSSSSNRTLVPRSVSGASHVQSNG